MQNNSFNNSFQVSTFNNIWDIDNKDLSKNSDVGVILDNIKTGNYGVSEKVKAIRSATTKDEKDKLKGNLKVVMWQGIFTKRSNSDCVSLSSLVCIDIDHRDEQVLDDIKRTISGWSFVWAYFRSPSGDGLKVIIKTDNYDIGRYSNCYRQVEQIFMREFGIKPDPSCEDLSHACYISHDPGLYHNDMALPWHYEYKPEFDKPVNPQYQRLIGSNDIPVLTPAEKFIAQMNKQRSSLTDEQIMRILDIKWSKFPDNYKDGNRTHSIFVQAGDLCKAGIDEDMAVDYLKSKFLPTGYQEWKLMHEIRRAYQKNIHLYCSERLNYKPYSQYKRKH